MKWLRSGGAHWSGAYHIGVQSFSVTVGTSASPRRKRYTLSHNGNVVMTSSGKTGLADCKAIAEHHALPYRQCPSVGCTSHADITRDSFDEFGCAVCDDEDVASAHWDSAGGTTLVAWSCCQCDDELESVRVNGRLTVDLINAHRLARKP